MDEASELLESLLDVLSGEEGLDTVLDRLVHTALWAIDGADTVSVTLVTGSEPRTVASTSSKVEAIDRDQYACGDGPCLEAARIRRPVRVSVEGARERWPEFARAAEAAGVRAYLSAPLVFPADKENDRDSDDELVGALNVYGFTPDAFDPFDESLLRLLTSMATASIGNARRYLRSRELSRQLRSALTSRAEIDQAKGALMAIHGVDADKAFGQLVEESQHRNVKLVEVARRFLATLRS
jgi:GAF domain-containing protein